MTPYPHEVHRFRTCGPLLNFGRSLPGCKHTRKRSFAGSFWRANWLGIGELPPRLGAQLSMQDTRRRNLRKVSRTAVGSVRPVRLNNFHKHSHGLLVSATSPAFDFGLCLGFEALRNTMLLIGDDEVVGNAFSARTRVSHCPFQGCHPDCGKFETSQIAEPREMS